MSIVRWRPRPNDPLVGLLDLRNEMDRLFSGAVFGEGNETGAWVPAMDVYEEKGDVVLRGDLPGLARDDIEVHVEDNVLTVKGTKKKEDEVREENYYRCERSYGTFSRTFRLPSGTDASKIKAELKDGVLSVRIPKTEEAKPKKVDIQVK